MEQAFLFFPGAPHTHNTFFSDNICYCYDHSDFPLTRFFGAPLAFGALRALHDAYGGNGSVLTF